MYSSSKEKCKILWLLLVCISWLLYFHFWLLLVCISAFVGLYLFLANENIKSLASLAIVGLYLSFQTITNNVPAVLTLLTYNESLQIVLFHFIQNTDGISFFASPYIQFFFRSGKLVCLSSGSAAYRNTMEHFPRTCLSILSQDSILSFSIPKSSRSSDDLSTAWISFWRI